MAFRIRVRIEESGPYKEFKDAMRDAERDLAAFSGRYMHFDYPLGTLRDIFFEMDAIRRKVPSEEAFEAAMMDAPRRFLYSNYGVGYAQLSGKVDAAFRQLSKLLEEKEREVSTKKIV